MRETELEGFFCFGDFFYVQSLDAFLHMIRHHAKNEGRFVDCSGTGVNYRTSDARTAGTRGNHSRPHSRG